MPQNPGAPGDKFDFFAADIHLSPLHPRRSGRFFAFLHLVAIEGRALYLLGDIFDLWLGDDVGGEFGKQVQNQLRKLANSGVAIYLQHGNRDFLLGESFAAAAGCKLIGDNQTIGGNILLTHGDKLAADTGYAVYRAVVRNAAARFCFGMLPKQWREYIATKLRAASDKTRRRPIINNAAAQKLLNRHKCQILIHGHLHTPADQQWQSNNKTYRRLCLPAWEGGGEGYIRIPANNGKVQIIAPQVVR